MPTGRHFPLAWNPDDRSVPAVDVTKRYAQLRKPAPSQMVAVRIFDRPGGIRISVNLELIDRAGTVLTRTRSKAGRADMNDAASIGVPSPTNGLRLKVTHAGKTRWFPFPPVSNGDPFYDIHWEAGPGG